MKALALMFAILMLIAAKGIARASELLGFCAGWIIDQCDPKPRRRT